MRAAMVTFGVEEEFLLVDPDTQLVVPRADEVIDGIPAELRRYARRELLATQVEIATPVCTGLAELRESLVALRSAASDAATAAGCLLLPAGTGPVDTPGPAVVARGPRFSEQAEALGGLADLPGLCACHVHVGVDDADTAAAVSNHLRPWLPVLHALGTNSPFAGGRDTGYASWRSMLAVRYPTSGPAPWLDSAAHHHRIVRRLIDSGVIADDRAVYWYARPSPVYPTIEVRVADVCPSVDDAVLLAALARALVVTMAAEVAADRPGPRLDDGVLDGAHWRAARYGLDGHGTDATGATDATGTRPAWDLVDALVELVGPALDRFGDLAAVRSLCGQVRTAGTGAARQRRVLAAAGWRAVVDYLAAGVADPSIRPAATYPSYNGAGGRGAGRSSHRW